MFGSVKPAPAMRNRIAFDLLNPNTDQKKK